MKKVISVPFSASKDYIGNKIMQWLNEKQLTFNDGVEDVTHEPITLIVEIAE